MVAVSLGLDSEHPCRLKVHLKSELIRVRSGAYSLSENGGTDRSSSLWTVLCTAGIMRRASRTAGRY